MYLFYACYRTYTVFFGGGFTEKNGKDNKYHFIWDVTQLKVDFIDAYSTPVLQQNRDKI